MSEQDDSLRELAAQTGSQASKDIILDGVQALISMVPVLGPAGAFAVQQLMPRDRDAVARDLAVGLVDRLASVDQTKLDRSYMSSAAFADDVDQVINALGARRGRSKREHYLAALGHAATTDRPEEVERQRFFDILDDLRPSHLRLLAVLVGAEHDHDGGSSDDWLLARLPDHDLENVRLDWADLQRVGLLDGIPSGMAMTPRGELMWASLKAIGRRFAAFVEAVPPSESER